MSAYEAFFGLNEKPFDLTPNPRYFFLSECHEEALSALIYGVIEKKGLITLTGPVGVGKTTILYSFFDQLKDKADIALFPAGIQETMPVFLKDLCTHLRIAQDKAPDYGLFEELKRFALGQLQYDRKVVVLVDEAQDLSIQALNMFRYLNNLETPEAKLIQIVLVGTDELDTLLAHEKLQSLRQRVSIRAIVRPLDPESSLEYIFHRVAIAGASADAIFTTSALWHILNYAKGIPRLINVVCDNAMMLAFARKKLPVDDSLTLETLKDLDKDFEARLLQETISKDTVHALCRVFARTTKEKFSRLESPPPTVPPAVTLPTEGPYAAHANEPVPPSSEPFPAQPHRDGQTTYPRSPNASFRPNRLWIALVGLACLLSIVALLAVLRNYGHRRDESKAARPQSEETSLLQPYAKDVPPEKEPSHAMPSTEAKEDLQTDSADKIPLVSQGPQQSEGRTDIIPSSLNGEPVPPLDVVPNPETIPGSEQTLVSFDSKDLAAIALEHYQTIDRSILKLLKDANPHISDWNKLGAHVELAIPPAPPSLIDATVDFFTVQLLSTTSETGAHKAARTLRNNGIENIFIIRHSPSPPTGTAWIRICAGIFETSEQCNSLVHLARQWGIKDAFPTRLQDKKLREILTP